VTRSRKWDRYYCPLCGAGPHTADQAYQHLENKHREVLMEALKVKIEKIEVADDRDL